MHILLHLISLHFYFIFLDQLISVLELVWLIFKLLLENYHLYRKELMAEWEGTTFLVTMELWLLNYYVDIYSRRKLSYLPFVLNRHYSYEDFIDWGLPRELQAYVMRCFHKWICHPIVQHRWQPWNHLTIKSCDKDKSMPKITLSKTVP